MKSPDGLTISERIANQVFTNHGSTKLSPTGEIHDVPSAIFETRTGRAATGILGAFVTAKSFMLAIATSGINPAEATAFGLFGVVSTGITAFTAYDHLYSANLNLPNSVIELPPSDNPPIASIE